MTIANNLLGKAVKAYREQNGISTGIDPLAVVYDPTGNNTDFVLKWNRSEPEPTEAQLQVALDIKVAEEQRGAGELAGFDYKGTQVSFTSGDRNTVTNADVAFTKKFGSTYMIRPEEKVTITFSNSNQISVDRTEFNGEFLPLFFTTAKVGLVA